MNHLKFFTLLGLVLTSTSFASSNSVLAATEEEKQIAIDAALTKLADTQQMDGRWIYSGGVEDVAATGAALLAFLEEGYMAGDGSGYASVVEKGLDYILSQATIYPFSAQTPGNPDADSNGNGFGIKFVPGGNNNRDTYVTGLALPAIAKSGTPNATVNIGGMEMTYAQVVQETIDYFAYGQNDSGSGRGGWRYFANSGSSDNSTAQWPPIAMIFAEEGMNIPTPDFVKDELAYWTEYIQNANGGSGYSNPNELVNEAKTGGLLVEMFLAENDTDDNSYDLNNEDLLGALDYLNTNWNNTISGTWNGNFDNPYAMWSIYKGLQVTVGLDDTTYIDNIPDEACGIQDPGDTCNWFEHYAEFLVQSQNDDGSWNVPNFWRGPLSWGWYVNILNATLIVNNPPVADANGPYSVELDNPFILDGSGSYDPDFGDSIVSWEWDLDGNGTTDGLGEMLAVATGNGTFFPNPGLYSIGLRVTDTGGEMGTDFTTVNVRPPGQQPTGVPEPSSVLGLGILSLIGGISAANKTKSKG